MSLHRTIVALPVLTLALALLPAAASAQQPGRATLGAQFVSMATSQTQLGPAGLANCRCFYYGFGFRVTVQLHGRVGLDGEVDLFPNQGLPGLPTSMREILFGPRFRVLRHRRWAVYLAARPGWFFVNPHAGCFCTGFPFSTGHHFGIDLGGTVDINLSPHWLWRAGAGDLIVPLPAPRLWPLNNPQLFTGLAYRF